VGVVKRAPPVVVAVVVATTLTAWVLRHAGRHAPAPIGAAATANEGRLDGAPPAASGLGVGVPPQGADDGAHGAQMLHGDARHTGRAGARAPTGAPALVWSRDVGGPVEAQVVTSPDEHLLYVASLGGSLTALARDDGSVAWTLALGDRSYATPCVAPDGTLYVGSDARKVLAVTPDGKVKWTLDTDGDADDAPVLAHDGTIVVAGGRMVYAVTPLGYVKWRFAAKRKVFSSPAVSDAGHVYFGSQDHHAYAVSPQGRLLWKVDLAADVDASPAIGDDGGVFFGTDGDEVVRLDADDGHVWWRTAVGGYVRGSLSVARNGDVLAGVYGPAPRAIRLDGTLGTVRGELPVQGTGAREFGVHGGALEDAAGVLLFGSQDDHVYALGPAGDTLWTFPTGGDVDAPITLLSDGTVIVGSDDGRVYALRAR
jgi:outer membrane protein assembly factor BamB